ncbi:MAG: CoA transferase, partial [Candidatus Limnocylindria bacterium]|nr:CoA transferase [Candidatus Limnocylindria bacterium]
ALAARERTGRGQHVDTSMQSAMATVLPPAPLWWDVVGDEHTRTGPYLLGRSVVGARFRNLWPSADGYVAFAFQGGAIGRHTGRELTRWMGERAPLPAALATVDWDTFDNARLTQAQVDELETAVAPFLASLTKAEFYAGCVARGMLGYPVSNAADIQADPQLEARGFWQELRLAGDGPAYRFPGGFALFDGARPSLRRGAPRVGEDDAVADGLWPERAARRAPAGTRDARALAGLNVVEMGFAAAGPLVGKYLGNLGAEVIRIESSKNLDVFRATYPPYKDNQPGPDRAGMFAFYNDGTRSVTLNLKDPRGVELAKRLIARADVLVESFTPGTVERLGLGPDALRAANPGLVLLRSCNQGQTGPHARHPGYGSQLTALAGFVHLLGEKGRTPALLYGPYIDYVAVGYGLTAVLAALRQRGRTGAGCVIDLSQYEAGVQFVAATILEEQVTSHSPERDENRDRVAAPHGSYPCAGSDHWVALSIWSDDEWRRFTRVLGDPVWAADPALATGAGRRAHTADLDRGIAEWTAARDRADVVRLVRAAGLRVAPVVVMSELFNDPQLVHRNAWPALPHPVIGTVHGMAPPFLLSATPARLERAGPCLGADTEAVLADRLGIGAAERAALREAGALE